MLPEAGSILEGAFGDTPVICYPYFASYHQPIGLDTAPFEIILLNSLLPLASELPHSLVFSFFLLLHGSSFFTRISRRCPWTFCPQQKLTISHVFKYYLMSSTFILIKSYFSPVFRIFPDQLFFSSSWMSHKHLKLNIFKVKLIVFSTAPHQRSLSQLLRLKSRE